MKMNKTHLNTASLNVCRLNMVGEFSKKSPLLSVCTSGADVVELEDAKGNTTSLTLKGYTTKEGKAVVCNNGKVVGVDKDLPQGYARLTGIVMNDDTYYEIDGFRLKGSDTLKVSFTALKACNILGCYTTTDAEDNYSIFASTTSGAKYLRYNGGTYLSAITAGKRYDITITPTGATGFDKASTWKEANFTSSTDMLIGSTSVNATSAKMTGTIHGNIEVVGRALFVPCKRLSDGTIGYYETYNKVFYAPSVGVPVAEGYDTSRIDVVYGDNPEKIEVNGIVSSASVANLWSVDRFVDEQEIVKGAVTRRLGVLVLDGSEKWIKATNASADGHAVFYVTVNERANNDTSLKLLSSHYSFRGTVSYSTLKTGEMSITQTTKNIYFDGGNATSTAEWASYLAEQYASCNPVVVVYPLAEEKTESVKGQSIKLAEGHNTITRVSGVSGLEMTCCYKQKPKPEDTPSTPKEITFNAWIITGGGGLGGGMVEYENQTFTAIEGMTWKEFIDSEEYGWDSPFFYYEGMGVFVNDAAIWAPQEYGIFLDGILVSENDKIIADAQYDNDLHRNGW